MYLDTKSLQTELQELDQELADPRIFSDTHKLAQISKRHAEITKILHLSKSLQYIEQQKIDALDLMSEGSDPELTMLAEEDLQRLEQEHIATSHELQEILHPSEPSPNEILIEIRAGAGGDEAGLFASEMFKAYTSYLQTKGAKIEVLNISDNNVGGIKEVTMEAKASEVFKYMKYESGVHRVQRVPKTEKAGRVHTSTITVAVLPVAEEVDIEINPNDLKIDVFRSSGPGGQSVNTTDSAVRITHIPSGVVVSCQDEKSQLKNREKALKILRSKLLAKQKEDQAEKESTARKNQIGTGDRSEKIRTYNFPQDRITDHRIKQNFSNIEKILMGDFDPIVTACHDYQTNQREHTS